MNTFYESFRMSNARKGWCTVNESGVPYYEIVRMEVAG